jgi:hypothetical protein
VLVLAGRQTAGKLGADATGEDGTEDGDADRAAQLAEELRQRGHHADVAVVDRALAAMASTCMSGRCRGRAGPSSR